MQNYCQLSLRFDDIHRIIIVAIVSSSLLSPSPKLKPAIAYSNTRFGVRQEIWGTAFSPKTTNWCIRKKADRSLVLVLMYHSVFTGGKGIPVFLVSAYISGADSRRLKAKISNDQKKITEESIRARILWQVFEWPALTFVDYNNYLGTVSFDALNDFHWRRKKILLAVAECQDRTDDLRIMRPTL